MAWAFGDLILARYNYWRHDQLPFVFILFDTGVLIDGLNSHYLSKPEVEQLRRLIASVQPGQEGMVYPFLKQRFNSVLRGYRKYKSQAFFPIKRWKVKELSSPRTRQEQDKEIAYNVTKMPSVNAFEKALLKQMKDLLIRLEKK
jgi:hypothetical protein